MKSLLVEDIPDKQTFFNKLLANRGNNYEIDTELQVRKILENHTDYCFEFQKNDNKYEYDLVVYKYMLSNGNYKKVCLGYVEVEVSEEWINNYPPHWKYYSFLMRKVYDWNKANQEWEDNLKPNAENTIYVIFNKSLTDCIAQKMTAISLFDPMRIYKCNNTYNDTALRCQVKDNDKIIRGIDNFITFTLDTFNFR